jgi:hypothetical protein
MPLDVSRAEKHPTAFLPPNEQPVCALFRDRQRFPSKAGRYDGMSNIWKRIDSGIYEYQGYERASMPITLEQGKDRLWRFWFADDVMGQFFRLRSAKEYAENWISTRRGCEGSSAPASITTG